nr:hypothetical protein [uncultured Psychrobacter sp.]
MNHLTVGQRAPLSNLSIDDTAPIMLKLTSQSPIEMDISFSY